MKNLMILLSLTFISVSAFAANSTEYLAYHTGNGSVNPMYSYRVNCTISSDGVFIQKIMGDIAEPSKAKLKWTGIRNEAILQSLISEASSGMVVVPKHPLPIGGKLATYATFVKGKEQKPLKTTVGGMLASINTSAAAKRLVDFIQVNCASAMK